jgi:periplasmic protein TonB
MCFSTKRGLAMQYVMRERSFGKNVTRFGVVVGAHVVLVGALVTSLNHISKFTPEPPPIDLVKIAPVTPEKPKVEPPRPIEPTHKPVIERTTVPLPDFHVERPAVVETITATPTNVVQNEPRDPSPSNTADSGTTMPTASNLGVACPNAAQVQGGMRYPAQAAREGLEGDVTARFVVTAAGEIKNIAIVGSTNRVFNNVVTQAVQQFGCRGQGQDVTVEAPFTFRLK